MTTPGLYRIYNEGDIPALPSGWRTVFAKEGRKWVEVTDWTTLEGFKLSMADWHRIKPRPAEADRRRIRQHMKARSRIVAPTARVKEIMAALAA